VKIRVHKWVPGEPTHGQSKDRPWRVLNVPDDYGRQTCWTDWADAMDWATMGAAERKAIIEYDLKMEGGW
jgi:hypothetical protein